MPGLVNSTLTFNYNKQHTYETYARVEAGHEKGDWKSQTSKIYPKTPISESLILSMAEDMHAVKE